MRDNRPHSFQKIQKQEQINTCDSLRRHIKSYSLRSPYAAVYRSAQGKDQDRSQVRQNPQDVGQQKCLKTLLPQRLHLFLQSAGLREQPRTLPIIRMIKIKRVNGSGPWLKSRSIFLSKKHPRTHPIRNIM